MSDDFRVIGDQVHFGPWVVATLKEGLPATVRGRVLKTLMPVETPEEAYKNGFDDCAEGRDHNP